MGKQIGVSSEVMFGEQSLVGRIILGEILTKPRLKELANLYRLIVVVGREIHIITDPLELNDRMYPDNYYRVEEIDVRGQWVEVRHHSQKKVPITSKQTSDNEKTLNYSPSYQINPR